MELEKINYTKSFGKMFGGKWKYDHFATWFCDDGIRHVSRVSSCSCDDICSHSPNLYLYGDGTPRIIYLSEITQLWRANTAQPKTKV